MVQTLKPERRERLIAAAEEVFARRGYAGATIAEIARAAGVSAANVYLYFENKDALFYEVFSDEFTATFLRLLKKRVAGLVRVKELTALDAEAEGDAQQLLRFWIDNRLKVVTILDRAHGSRHEGFRALFVAELMRPTLAKMRADAAGKRLDPRVRFVLERIFDNTVQMIVSILQQHAEEADIRAAISAFWSYQLAGMSGFTKRVTT
jgi:AcrR family transcriptional regulator